MRHHIRVHQEDCDDPFVDELQFRCADNVHCTYIFDRCNGINNCADGSDEVGCATTTHGATLEVVTGYASTILTPAIHEHILFDRECTIDSLGSFEGHTLIEMSMEDKRNNQRQDSDEDPPAKAHTRLRSQA